jgi:hypothetical protein
MYSGVHALCYPRGVPATSSLRNPETSRHSAIVRVTHWITVVSFFALLISGAEIVISHPRFYWGEVGNALTPPMFTLPIPASRNTVFRLATASCWPTRMAGAGISTLRPHGLRC